MKERTLVRKQPRLRPASGPDEEQFDIDLKLAEIDEPSHGTLPPSNALRPDSAPSRYSAAALLTETATRIPRSSPVAAKPEFIPGGSIGSDAAPDNRVDLEATRATLKPPHLASDTLDQPAQELTSLSIRGAALRGRPSAHADHLDPPTLRPPPVLPRRDTSDRRRWGVLFSPRMLLALGAAFLIPFFIASWLSGRVLTRNTAAPTPPLAPRLSVSRATPASRASDIDRERPTSVNLSVAPAPVPSDPVDPLTATRVNALRPTHDAPNAAGGSNAGTSAPRLDRSDGDEAVPVHPDAKLGTPTPLRARASRRPGSATASSSASASGKSNAVPSRARADETGAARPAQASTSYRVFLPEEGPRSDKKDHKVDVTE